MRAITAPPLVDQKEFANCRQVGNGAFAAVEKVRHKPTGAMCAIKKLPYNPLLINEKNSDSKREVDILNFLKQTEHRNIIKIFDIFQGDREHIHVLMDFCNYDLHNFLTSETHNSPEIYDNIFGQIADGLHFLHTHTPQIVHRDIHPGNVLVKQAESEKAIMVKIADFGISHVVSTEIGSPRHTALGVFMAPEVMSASHMELKYHPTVDIYGLGLIYNYMYCFSQSSGPSYAIRRLQALL